MATLAADHDEARTNAGPPISTHPAFPAIVALWFAALLGLGSLILPTPLLERLATVTGLASLIPSAAPPLGFTARATIAIGGAVLGAVLGLVLARQVAAGQAPRPRTRFSDDMPRRRPISAHDELGEEGLDAPASRAVVTKRRSLAIAEDAAPSRYLSPVPLPGQDAATGEAAEEPAEDPLELTEYVVPPERAAAQEDQDLSMNHDLDPAESSAPEAAERQEFVAPGAARTGMRRAFDPMPEPDEEEEDETAFDALPFTPPSLRRAQTGGIAEASPPVPQPYQAVDEPETQIEFVEQAPGNEADGFDDAIEDRPLEEMGLVQLATRLGSAIERRRARQAASPTEHPAPRPVFAAEEEFDAAEADEAARARADFFGTQAQSAPADPKPASFPAAVRSPAPLGTIDFGEDDDNEADDLAASFSLPLRKRAETLTAAAVPVGYTAADDDGGEDDDEDPTAEQEYSSLLAMKNPFRKEEEFVRVEEPEPDEDEIEATVTFPERKEGSIARARPFDPPADAADGAPGALRKPGEAERELRAALETLQRMSGAA